MTQSDLKTVLLVEDNQEDSMLILNHLLKNNVTNEVVLAAEGERAIRLLTEGENGDAPLRPDLVLLDMRLPGIDGFEVLSRLKASGETQVIPVVVLSGTMSTSDIRKAYELGANSVIIKPTASEDYADVILNTTMYWLLVNRTAYGQPVPSDF